MGKPLNIPSREILNGAKQRNAQVWNLTHNVLLAEGNAAAGHLLLAVPAGWKFRLVDATIVSVGGATGTCTSVDLVCGDNHLLVFAQGNLTQHTVLRPGVTGCSVINDGASFEAQAAGADVSLLVVGTDADGATSWRVTVQYALDKA